jgi:hypothetical protein
LKSQSFDSELKTQLRLKTEELKAADRRCINLANVLADQGTKMVVLEV